ncbi:hypothetical protein COV24_03050 [candidate division WWE3 bacterium CG10_big_fil_rev_8_21_14_0_10_32_10]|uniref:Uncharacterized protein n=1 Tax=candidate division WWE3 bacterium CG10_big_fil_rev_8_21_14_0_10_32_10 TaxID=1975090 RepID=A0A2H0RA98_UNCKA|nr:MAG: hypothetical protein COV24_03050 [candidate division WWE3 bacterium CG10_big_fil_rev_8_21_14_0_10_32_10]
MYDEAIFAMKAKAHELGIEGAGGIVLVKEGAFTEGVVMPALFAVGEFTRGPKNGDDGANYLAVALSKFAEMMDTNMHSGLAPNRPVKKGEFGYRGGLVHFFRNGWLIKAFFSGGSAEQDCEVAIEGIKALI